MAQSLAQVLVNEQPLQEMVPPEQSIGYQVRRLNQEMTDAMARFVSRHGISGPHWGYLRHIYFDDGLSQRELSDRMARQGATTVTALKRLEKAGFVTSRPHETDQRKNRIYLTHLRDRTHMCGSFPLSKLAKTAISSRPFCSHNW